MCSVVFFFKQKTAYEMRISDWSSDVCSSDLYSSMNAGKSTTLLQSSFNYRERGMETMLWTAAIDDRYERGLIVSRIGLEAKAHLFDAATDLFAPISARHARPPLSCVLVEDRKGAV